MHTAVRPRLVFVSLLLLIGTPTSIESTRWWQSPRFVAALHLTTAQRAAIERIYLDMLPERASRVAESNAAREALNRLMESDAPEAVVEAAATRAADADAARARTRTLMLYRMLRVLTPKQRAELARAAPRRRITP